MKVLFKLTVILASIFTFVNVVIFIHYYIFDFIKIDFLYLCIKDYWETILFCFFEILIGIIIPIVLFKAIITIQKKSIKKQIQLIILPIFVILLALNSFVWFIYSDLFALGGFYSHTENVSDYGTYDNAVEEIITAYDLDEFLPDKSLVEKYGEYNYSFEYFIYRENIFVIETDIQFPDNDTYEKELNRLLSINSPTKVLVKNIYCDFYGSTDNVEIPWESTGRKYLKTAIFDNDKKSIKYVIENGIYKDSLAKTVIDSTTNQGTVSN